MTEPFRVTLLGEIGRNCAMLENEGKWLVLDYGIRLPPSVSTSSETVRADELIN
jgi:mRNA degradation ribonuclease J1/J2